MNHTKSSSIIFLTVSNLSLLLTGYLSSVWLARFLGPIDFGTYGIIVSIITAINIFQSAGLPHAVSKYIAENKENSDAILTKALKLQIIYSLSLTSTVFLLSKPIAYILNDFKLIPYIQLASISFLFYGIFSLYIGYYNGLQMFTRQAVINITQSVVRLITIILLSYFFYIKGAIFGFIVASFIACIVAFHLPKNINSQFSYKKLILFSIPIIGFTFLITLMQSLDIFFVKALTHANENTGYYNASQSIARIPFFALSVFSAILFPAISQNVSQKLHQKSRVMIHKSLRYILLILIPITLIISVTGNTIIGLLYSTAYLPAAPSLSILIFASGFLTVFTVLANILNGAGMPEKSLWISAVGVILTVFSCFFMVPKYGLIGASLSTTIGSFVAMILATYYVYKRFNALIPVKSVIKIASASLIIYFLAKFIILPPILLPFIYIFLFGIYLLILILLKEVTKEDWKKVQKVIPSWVPVLGNL